jgi:UDP-2,3-diacylglucosamine pyrophosphatase LpxH
MFKVTPAQPPLTAATVRPTDSVSKARSLYRGRELLPLTYSAQDELARAHGSHEAALEMRNRTRMQRAPTDGSGNRTERLLIISDLHPSSGIDPETGRFDALDDFGPTQQRQLSSWMTREWVTSTAPREDSWIRDHVFERLSNVHQVELAEGNIDVLRKLRDAKRNYDLPMVLLGDIVDLLQVPRIRPGFRFPDGLASHRRAPRNTPANCLVQLNIIYAGHQELFRTFAMHLFLGNRIDFVPGNHDRALYHPLLWSGQLTIDGKPLYGFKGLIDLELQKIGATADERRDALERLQLLPFVIHDDTLLEHGDQNDLFNKVRRPYKEFIDPTPIHEEMELAVADHGVRDGFNDIERARPTLDSIENNFAFWAKAFSVPRHALRLMLKFFQGATREGYDVSPADDQRMRANDIATLVSKNPRLLEMANQMRPEGDRLSRDEFVRDLQAIDRVSARPFFSNFKRGTNFLTRCLTVAARGLLGDVDVRRQGPARLDRIEAWHRVLGINNVVDGHTHIAKNEYFLTRQEKLIHHVNTHTWMNKSGDWNEDGNHWGDASRGVGLLEHGVTATGIPWSELSLMRVVDEDGALVPGELMETFEPSESAVRNNTRALFESNRRRMGVQQTPVAPTEGDEWPPRMMGGAGEMPARKTDAERWFDEMGRNIAAGRKQDAQA